MKKANALILSVILLMMTALSACGNSAGLTQGYKDIIKAVNYGDETTYVIGHKSPDSDTVGSAIAYAYLLGQLGIKAEAAVSEEVNGETAYALKTFGISVPTEIMDASGKQFVLVDHSTYSQTIDGMDSAKIVGIIDHHGIGEIEVSDLINVRSAPVGAASSLVYLAYKECGVAIPKDMAQVMLMGILSDTRNMKRDVTGIDRETANMNDEDLKGFEDGKKRLVDACVIGLLVFDDGNIEYTISSRSPENRLPRRA